MLDSKCVKAAANGDRITTFIHDGYMTLKSFLYPCTIEFSLMSLTVNRSYLPTYNLEFIFWNSYSFLFGKILARHLLIESLIKHRPRMSSRWIVMPPSKVSSVAWWSFLAQSFRSFFMSYSDRNRNIPPSNGEMQQEYQVQHPQCLIK